MSKAVKDVDHGYTELVKRVFAMGAPDIDVGVLENKGADKAEGDDVRVVDVASWAEFGTDTQPERSWLRAFFDEHKEECRNKLADLLKKVIEGTLTEDQALEQFGLWAVGQIQKRIADGIAPENAPSTIEKKGSDKPLIDTGVFRSAISYRVEKVEK